jgi:hypothetical protein
MALTFDGGYFASLNESFEPAQVLPHDEAWISAEELRNTFPENTGGRPIDYDGLNDGSAIGRGVAELDGTVHFDFRAGQGSPRDQLILSVSNNFRFPGETDAERGESSPAISGSAGLVDRINVVHEARQILKVVPEAVCLFWRAVQKYAAVRS